MRKDEDCGPDDLDFTSPPFPVFEKHQEYEVGYATLKTDRPEEKPDSKKKKHIRRKIKKPRRQI
ncbi:MAG: hypothetical protein CMO55_10115 [Verrucomicrobiales bacterium]|nr:hypothetical protein [Verrucomicrobiales bacterium]